MTPSLHGRGFIFVPKDRLATISVHWSQASCVPKVLKDGIPSLILYVPGVRSSYLITSWKSLPSKSNASTCISTQLLYLLTPSTELRCHFLLPIPTFPSPSPNNAIMPSQQLPFFNLIHHLQPSYPLFLFLIHTLVPQLINVRSSTSIETIGFHPRSLRF